MKPQTKPFLVEIKSSRRFKRAHLKTCWLDITRVNPADEQSENTSRDADQKHEDSDDKV